MTKVESRYLCLWAERSTGLAVTVVRYSADGRSRSTNCYRRPSWASCRRLEAILDRAPAEHLAVSVIGPGAPAVTVRLPRRIGRKKLSGPANIVRYTSKKGV